GAIDQSQAEPRALLPGVGDQRMPVDGQPAVVLKRCKQRLELRNHRRPALNKQCPRAATKVEVGESCNAVGAEVLLPGVQAREPFWVADDPRNVPSASRGRDDYGRGRQPAADDGNLTLVAVAAGIIEESGGEPPGGTENRPGSFEPTRLL